MQIKVIFIRMLCRVALWTQMVEQRINSEVWIKVLCEWASHSTLIHTSELIPCTTIHCHKNGFAFALKQRHKGTRSEMAYLDSFSLIIIIIIIIIIVYLSLSEISQTEYVGQREKTKLKEIQKIGRRSLRFLKMENAAFSSCCFAKDGKEMDKEL